MISQQLDFQKQSYSFEQIIENIQHFEIKLTPIEYKDQKDPYDFMLDQDKWLIGKNSDSETWEYIDRFQKYAYVNAESMLGVKVSFITLNPMIGVALLCYRSFIKRQLNSREIS